MLSAAVNLNQMIFVTFQLRVSTFRHFLGHFCLWCVCQEIFLEICALACLSGFLETPFYGSFYGSQSESCEKRPMGLLWRHLDDADSRVRVVVVLGVPGWKKINHFSVDRLWLRMESILLLIKQSFTLFINISLNCSRHDSFFFLSELNCSNPYDEDKRAFCRL